MKIFKKSRAALSTILATVIIGGVAFAQAPYRLPASHTTQHKDLIAHQKSISTSMTKEA